MFDYYRPIPPIPCPVCRDAPESWQGKEGPNALFVWEQGQTHPVDQRADEDAKIERERYVEFSLPDHFQFWTSCANGHELEAGGESADGTWWRSYLRLA